MTAYAPGKALSAYDRRSMECSESRSTPRSESPAALETPLGVAPPCGAPLCDCAPEGDVAQPDTTTAKISAVVVRWIERPVDPPIFIVSGASGREGNGRNDRS